VAATTPGDHTGAGATALFRPLSQQQLVQAAVVPYTNIAQLPTLPVSSVQERRHWLNVGGFAGMRSFPGKS